MPFGSFKSIDYNYVPKHNLEVIGQTYDYLQQRHDAAVAQESALKKQIGELELNAQEDEFKQMLVNSIESKIQDAAKKWDFANDKYNVDYIRGGVSLAQEGINNIKSGFGGAFDSIRNIGNPNSLRYRNRYRVRNYGNEGDSI